MTKIEVAVNVTVELPPRDSYDYQTYTSHIWMYAGVATAEDVDAARARGDLAQVDQWVGQAMVLDYLERHSSCTASNYVRHEVYRSRTV